jgi:5-methylthioadenosine/S-adenosylhomocysteine deaminase
MSDILIRGAVLRGVSAGGEAEIVEDGAVFVSGSVIRAVDRWQRLASLHPEAMVLGSPRMVVAPGFVNAHHHVGLTPFQLGAPDLPLELWFVAKIGLPAVDPYLDTLYSAFEMIASGVTTVQHLHIARAGLSEVDAQATAILRAYADIGMRVSYSFGFRDQNRLVYEDDDVFLAGLPCGLAAEARGWFKDQHIAIGDYLGWFEAMRSRYATSDKVAIQLAPANLHWCSDKALVAIGDASQRSDAPMHIHLLETERQKAYAEERFGTSAVRHLADLGLLGPRVTLGHMVWCDEADLDIVAQTGACICHNVSSNLRLGSGIAPCPAFLRRGIPTAIGIDEAGINDDRDMLQEMRLALVLHRARGLDESAVTAADIFRMATASGGRTTPFGERIGRLDPEAFADLVFYDRALLSGPYLDSSVALIDALIQRGRPDAVRGVMIGGSMVYEKGRFLRVDRDAAHAEIAAALAHPQSEAQLRRRSLARALMPHVKALYASADGQRRL